MKLVIGEIELKPSFRATARMAAISRPMPVFRWLVLTLIFSLLWFREYSTADGPRSFLYVESWGGFRLADLLVMGLVYFHLLWILGTRQPIPRIPSILKKPALLFLVALGISICWGVYQGGTHVYFDWRDIFLGAGLALVFSCWIRTPEALHEALYIFAAVMGLRVLYILTGYVAGTRANLTVISGFATPYYDSAALSAAVFLALMCFQFVPLESSSFQKIVLVIAGGAGLLVLLSFRRALSVDLTVGVIILAAFKRRRIAAYGLIVVIAVSVALLGGNRVYQRIKSMDPFATGPAEYTSDNEDHVNDVLEAFDQVKQHPLLGIGLGRTYRTPRLSAWKVESWGVHNGLLHTWLLYGLLGLVDYLWFHASVFRWLKRLHAARLDPRVRALAQVGLAYLVGPFILSFAFSPLPYGSLTIDILVFFTIGSLLSLQAASPRLRRE